MTERITGSAIEYPTGVEVALAPGRHGDVIRAYWERTQTVTRGEWRQGFVTDTGRFVDREEGARIAIASGQADPAKMTYTDMLFSEDLW